MPSERLHKEHTSKRVDRRFLEDVVVIRDTGNVFWGQVVVGAGTRNKVLVALNGHGRFVVSVMRRAPGVVGNQNKLEYETLAD